MGLRFTFFFLIFLMVCARALAQVQLGANIEGAAPGDQSGFSVAISADGSRLAVGAPYNSQNGINSGHVRVYQWNGTDWNQLGDDINGEVSGDQTGVSVSLSAAGNILAVGSIGSGPNGTAFGQVIVYSWDGFSWISRGASIMGEAANDQFGRSVSLSSDGNLVAIGSRNNAGNGTNSGHVRVFQWNGSDWSQLGKDIDGEEPGDQSGGAVAISADGSRLAIGATFNNDNGGNAGHTRVFYWDGMEWVQLGTSIKGEAPSNFLGWSVSLSADGSRLAVGAPFNDGNGEDSGQVVVHEWNGMDWEQLGDEIYGEAPGDRSGASVSISANGNLLAIGATEHDGVGVNSGHARLFGWDGTKWLQLGSEIGGEAPGDRAGFSVALSTDGNILAVSALSNDGNGEDAGHVQVYGDIITTINNFTTTDFVIFPNPATNEFYFRGLEASRVEIFDCLGRLILGESKPGQGVNVSSLLAGVYSIRIYSKEKKYIARFMKQ